MQVAAIRRVASLAIVVAVTVVGCSSGPSGPSGADLAATAGFALDYPGAVEVSRSLGPSTPRTDDGSHYNTSRRTLATDGSRDEVFAFYDDALLADGWVRTHGLLSRCSTFMEFEWGKGESMIGLGWYDLFDVASRPCDDVDPTVIDAHTTVYGLAIGWKEGREPKSFEPRPSATPNPAVAALRLLDAWELAAPGSREIGSGANRATDDTAADTWRRYRYDGPSEDVRAYFERALADRGWSTGAGWRVQRNVRTDEAVCGWNRDGTGLLLQFRDPKAWNDVFELLPYETVYVLRLIDHFEGPTDVACDPVGFSAT